MHRIYQLFWGIRSLLYRYMWGSFGFPGYIGKPIFIYNMRKIFIGRRVRIFPGLRAECHGDGSLIIHDNVSIGHNFHVVCSSELNIRSGCLISAGVFITDTDHTYTNINIPVFDQDNQVSRTDIGENCFIGIGSKILAGTILGKGCVVGANSTVRGIYPDFVVIAGSPARIVKRYNIETSSWERSSD